MIDESMAVKFKIIDRKMVLLSIGSDSYEVSYRQLSNEFSKLRIRMISEKYQKKKNVCKKNK